MAKSKNKNISKNGGGCCSGGTCSKKANASKSHSSNNTKSISTDSIDIDIDIPVSVPEQKPEVKKSGGCCSGGKCSKNAKQVPTPVAPAPAPVPAIENPPAKKGGCCSGGTCSSKKSKAPAPSTIGGDESKCQGHCRVGKTTILFSDNCDISKEDREDLKVAFAGTGVKIADASSSSKKKKGGCSSGGGCCAPKPKASSCTHDHGHDHGHGTIPAVPTIRRKKSSLPPGTTHDKPDCIAILREDGDVDVYDVKGTCKTFRADTKSIAAINSAHNPKCTNKKSISNGAAAAGANLCFNSHGRDVGMELPLNLTPCFDGEGMHGDPLVKCQIENCGVEGPHLHAHLHNANTCIDGIMNDRIRREMELEMDDSMHGTGHGSVSEGSEGTSTPRRKIQKRLTKGNIMIHELTNVTLYPKSLLTGEMDSSKHSDSNTISSAASTSSAVSSKVTKGKGKSKDKSSSAGGSYMPLSKSLPHACNANTLTQNMHDLGVDVKKYDESKHSIIQVQHDDHYDTLVHNSHTGQITLEHDCEDCGGMDVHGTLDFVNQRTLEDINVNANLSPRSKREKKNRSGSGGGLKMNFYRIPSTPLQLLDVLSDFFAMEDEKASVLRNALPSTSPSRNSARRRKNCCTDQGCTAPRVPLNSKRPPSCCATGTCTESMDSDMEDEAVADEGASTTVRSTIHVKHICCASEIPMINSIVQPLKGVVAESKGGISISTTTKLVHVHHDPDIISAGDIVAALNRERFGATLKKDGGLVAAAAKARNLAMGAGGGATSGRSSFFVSGICCSAEIPMINGILEPLKGVEKVSINVPNKTVYVEHTFASISASVIKETLDKERFDARIEKDAGAEAAKAMGMGAGGGATSGRSSFFVSGICCSAEIPMINGILEPLKGVEKVSINVPNKTVYVEHTFALISASVIKETLDKERFDARIEKDAGAEVFNARATIMSKYVESTFLIESAFDQEIADLVQPMLREQYSKEHVSHAEAHVPSRTIKVDHNPQLVSAETLVSFFKTHGTNPINVSIIADGFKEGIWSSGDDADHVEEEHTGLQWHIIFSGIFWITSMLHFIGGGWDFLKWFGVASVVLGIPKIAMKAFTTMRRRQFDTNCMMFFATCGALALQEYSEAAAVTFLFSISDWLETLSTARARNALSAIVKLRPERAKVKDPISGNFVFAPASSVGIGSIVSVRTGDKIPCDGVVVEGSSVVDESSLTGESRPVQKVPGSTVSGGTVNAGVAQLLIQTTSTSENSAVARLIRLVEDAQANRSPTEKLIDAFAKRYTPLVVLLALSMCTFPWIAGPDVGREWTKIGLVTIVIACPCALIISTPVTYVAGLAAAAQRGIVVKGGAHLESLGRVNKIAFDKTGTLTEGNFKLLHLRTWGTKSREQVLQLLYCIEGDASHPLAAAMVAAAKSENVSVPGNWKTENHQNLDGEGVKAEINGQTVHVGNFRLFERLAYITAVPADELQHAKEWMDDGGTVGFLSVDGIGIVASYCVADALREEAEHVIASFNKLGIDTNMLTGDNSKAALSIGRRLGLAPHQIKSQLLPHEKLDLIKEFIAEERGESNDADGTSSRSCLEKRRRGLVLMCGDGVNDAPALAIADVGVAMGAGAALAMETADVTLLDSNLLKLLKVVTLGRRVTRTIIENVVFSFVAKAVVMGFTFAGYSSLWAAIGSDVGSMLIVTANGMKLLPSKKSVRAGTGFDKFNVRSSVLGGVKAGVGTSNKTSVSFPISVSSEKDALIDEEQK